MPAHFSRLSVALLAASALYADEGASDTDSPPITTIQVPSAVVTLEEAPVSLETNPEAIPALQEAPAPTPVIEKAISPFTGKIKGRKVRLRAGAGTDSRVVKELSRGDYVVVIGEKGDYYAVEPTSDTPVYVFRSFVLDGVVEGNRVNVRLSPSLEAPVVAHLNSGDRVEGKVAEENNKWFKIAPPEGTKFYIAKEYVEYVGNPELKAEHDKRVAAVQDLFEGASALTESELAKPFDQFNLVAIQKNYDAIINDYTDFPDYVAKAKEASAQLQESYLQKRLAFLEEKASEAIALEEEKHAAIQPALNATDLMKLWEPQEESAYFAWARHNEGKPLEEFYSEELLNAEKVTGLLEPFSTAIKNKPGAFILKNESGLPLCYLYSTKVNLQEKVGQKVTVTGNSRPNNHFAFPAYHVLLTE